VRSGIPSKQELEIQVFARRPDGNQEVLTVLDFDRFVDFSRNKIVVQVFVAAPSLMQEKLP
jgi:hypothetical protein